MRSLKVFRVAAFVSACVLGALASWILAAELARPPSPKFPAAVVAPAAEQDKDEAAAAARLGVIRGDLWADDAILQAAGMQIDFAAGGATAGSESLAAARAAAEQAVRLSPHDSRMWLLIAAIDARRDPSQRLVDGPLKMSYYTAPNDPALMKLRLIIATHSEAIADPDLQLLVRGEIRTIIKGVPDLKPALVAAYRGASAPGRRFIEDELAGLDSDLLAQIRVRGAPP